MSIKEPITDSIHESPPSFLFMNHLARLPNEILTSILTALDVNYIEWRPFPFEIIRLYQCALVNKTFYAVATPLLWRQPISDNFFEDTLAETHSFLRCLVSSYRPAFLLQHIRQLHICDPDQMQPMMPFMHLMTLLETFTMKGHVDWSVEGRGPLALGKLGPTCTRLEKVSFWGARLSDPALVTISQWCGPIQDLMLEYCTDFTDVAHHTLLDTCRTSLTSLKLYENHWTLLLCKSLKPFQLQQLTSLSLTKCQGVDNDFLRGSRFPLLTDCHIQECSLDLGNAPDTLSFFLRLHPLLRILTLNGCKINNAALAVMVPSVLPNLSDLNLSNNDPPLSCQLLRHMIKNCLGLSYIAAAECFVPVRNFAELPQWSGTIDAFQREDIMKIRNNDTNVVFTAEDDELRECERLYLPVIDLSLHGEPEESESNED